VGSFEIENDSNQNRTHDAKKVNAELCSKLISIHFSVSFINLVLDQTL